MDYKAYLSMTKSEAYIELHKYYTQETILDVLGVARQENPHSAFLRWLFDIRGSHGLGAMPLRRLLETVCLAREELYDQISGWFDADRNLLSDCQKEYYDYIKYGRYEVLELGIANELTLQNQRRADIFIAARLRFYDRKDTPSGKPDKDRWLILIIENKIHSLEHDNQTKVYAKAVFDQENAKTYIAACCPGALPETAPLILPIYLNAAAKHNIAKALNKGHPRSEILPASHQFLTLNYQYLLDGVLETVLPYCTVDAAAGRIREYIRCLGQATLTSLSDSKRSDQKHLIMAVSSREKELTKRLLSAENKPIILEIFRSFALTETRLVDQQEQPFWTSIANVCHYLFQEQALEPDAELREAVNCVLNTTNGSQNFYLQFGDKLIGFGSGIGKRTEQTVGELAYYLIAQYVRDHPNETWDSIVGRLYAQSEKNRITNNWLCGALIPQSHVVALANAWASKHNDACSAVCGKYNCKTGFVNGELHSCVLWANEKNPLYRSYSGDPSDPAVAAGLHSCPIYPQEANRQLWEAYRAKEASGEYRQSGRNVSGRGCHCYYDFLNNFFVNELREFRSDPQRARFAKILEEEPKVSRSDKPLPPITIAGEPVYAARFWTASDIPKLIEVLGLQAYVSVNVPVSPGKSMSVDYLTKST